MKAMESATPYVSIEESNARLDDEHMTKQSAQNKSSFVFLTRSHLFRNGTFFGMTVASIAFLAAAAMIYLFKGAPPNGIFERVEYSIFYVIIILSYAIHFMVCVSSIAILVAAACFPSARATFNESLIKSTIVFQGGFFAGITLVFLIAQVFLPAEHHELCAFSGAFIDRLIMLAVCNSLFVGGGDYECDDHSSSFTEKTDDLEQDKYKILNEASSNATETNSVDHYRIMIV